MSEVVVRMEMPEDCFECPFGVIDDTEDGVWCNALAQQSSGQREDCPIVCALPENHWDLIDRETVAEGLSEKYNSCVMTCGAVMQFIDGLPTIVPATEGGNHEAD